MKYLVAVFRGYQIYYNEIANNKYGDMMFGRLAIRFNQLPGELKDAKSVSYFRNKLKPSIYK